MKTLIGIIILSSVFALFADTTIQEEYFSLKLPGKWDLVTKEKSDLLWVDESKEKNERLNVSVLPYKNKPNHKEKEKYLKEFIKVRRTEEAKTTNKKIQLSKEKYKEYSTAFGCSYYDIGKERKTYTKAISNSFGIGLFFYEALDFEEAYFNKRRDSVFSAIGFID